MTPSRLEWLSGPLEPEALGASEGRAGVIIGGRPTVAEITDQPPGPDERPVCDHGDSERDARCRLPAGHDSVHLLFSEELLDWVGPVRVRCLRSPWAGEWYSYGRVRR